VELPLNQILHGDCLELLKQLPDNSIESCVTDPPYGLGNKDPDTMDIFMYVLGATLDTGGDFMGRDWQLPSVSVWREVYRVLKPGGCVLAFGGTRTFDLISIGLRMAGFEARDTISREFPTVELPILQWLHSQGMPKSHAIGKAIDKKLGRERQVVGSRPIAYPDTPSGYTSFSANSSARKGGIWNESTGEAQHGRPVTAPASEEAAQWEGWGSALKPSWEPILLFRKPLEGTLANNVLEHGTGGLNIDATRVKHASKEDFEAHKAQVDAIKEKGGSRDKSWKNSSDLSGANEVKEGGRWPANTVIEHSANCERVGTKRVKSITGGAAPPVRQRDIYDAAGGYNKRGSEQPAVKAYGDSDGLEEVEAWSCAEGCPVRELNEQSGDRPSTLTGRADPDTSHEHPGMEMNPNSAFLGERTHLSRVYADQGGAARFFTQFEGADSSGGRWPSNSVWTHAEGCKLVGTKTVDTVPGGKFRYSALGRMNDDGWQPKTQVRVRYSDESGQEEVEAWECVEGCPVKALDEQGVTSGSHAAGNKAVEVNHTVGNKVYGGFKPMTNNPDYHADEGGVSRFFSQFDGVPFKYVPKANRKEAGCGEFEVQHITLKPLALLRWLVKLVTRKGGTVLDIYAGSATTCHAAVLEGMNFIGMERDETNHAEAVRRLEIVLRKDQERRDAEDLYEFSMGRG